MRIKGAFTVLSGLVLSNFPRLNAQSVQCATVAEGCNAGSVSEAAVTNAIDRFRTGLFYGGGDESIILSSASNGNNVAMITYLCNDRSPPPRLEGSVIRTNFRKILSCPNRCGGVALSSNSNCGFGVLIANNAVNIGCFSKAIDVVPHGTATTATTISRTTTTGQSAPTINPSTDGFNYYGCYSDDVNTRVLSNQYVDTNGMTIAACMARAAGYNFAGVEYGQECWYGNTLAGTSHAESSGCNMPCPGKATELCGGGNRIQLYKNPSYQPPGQPDTGAFVHQGCYTDSVEQRALEHTTTDWEGMTIQKCLQLGAGFKYAGVQYYGECHWGNVLSSSSSPAASGDCNTPCAGDNSQNCGGGNRLSLYLNTGYAEPELPEPPRFNEGSDPWSLVGCHSDSTSNRAFPYSDTGSTMTVAKCLELAIGFKYAAVQGGNTCYWGDELTSSAVDSSQCNSVCAGESGEICGGSLRNLIYENADFEVPDLAGMIVIMEELWACEKAAETDLREYDDLRLQAEAESQQGGNKHKRFIPLAWVARLTVAWTNARRVCLRCLGINIRFTARMQTAWRYVSRYLPGRGPQVVEEFEMQALILAPRHGAVVQRWAGGVVAQRVEEIAAGVVVGAYYFLQIQQAYQDINDALQWHRDVYGPVQPTDPDPPDNPDDPDDPPNDPEDLAPCPCGISGCSVPGLKLARSEPMKPKPLEKRTSGEKYSLAQCPTISYKTSEYPTSGEIVDIYGAYQLTIDHLDINFYTLPPLIPCLWNIRAYTGAQGANPRTAVLAEYATEHVFENHIMKGFFDEMVIDECAPCTADAQGPGINEMFFTRTPTGSRYHLEPFERFMVPLLTWFNKAYPNQGRLAEFFVLEQRINKHKNAVLTPTTAPDQLGVGLDMQEFIEHVGRVQAVFQYMNRAAVAQVFVATFVRLYNEFEQFDNDVAYGQQHGPRDGPGTPCLAASDAPTGAGWSYRFLHYIAAFLVDCETKMGAWADQTTLNFIVRRDTRWPVANPPTAPIPQGRIDFDAWLTAMRAPGGLLHRNSFKFDRTLYATFGLQ
ncbi:hypothetical protein TWF102_009377 [Orbilia oligospora]|uniref:WSC domain-containing protein n=1 Tax=Orbilia oligospora TaxID=2813651 RepID=A0A7C8N7N4_ORBOL|nr:hypothetical protein TWF102_009377 [Orbilia oligospora]KAF3099067.1 hypothetical protein TWF103_008840 [Orbilia oligospora]KAF3136720.1 hypothetical protein TWF703_005434 [Orbilia oligospora]